MESVRCISCLRPRASQKCGLCEGEICRDCAQFLEAGTFSFLKSVPPELSKTFYCNRCYDAHVGPALDSYTETLKRAKGVYVFFKTQRKPIPMVGQQKHERVQVLSCPDRDETIMRLAFSAAELSLNAVIEVDVTCEKVRDEGYQKMNWRGSGVPASVDAGKIERNELLRQN